MDHQIKFQFQLSALQSIRWCAIGKIVGLDRTQWMIKGYVVIPDHANVVYQVYFLILDG